MLLIISIHWVMVGTRPLQDWYDGNRDDQDGHDADSYGHDEDNDTREAITCSQCLNQL